MKRKILFGILILLVSIQTNVMNISEEENPRPTEEENPRPTEDISTI